MAAYEAAGQSDDWHTPRYIFDALGERFDMDVAAQFEGPRHVPTANWLWERGEVSPWSGFIWCNPPFLHQSGKRIWIRRFFDHPGILLLPDRTSAPWWQEAAPRATAILFVTPKIKFEKDDGSIGESPGTGTCLFANGERAKAALLRSGLGYVMVAASAAHAARQRRDPQLPLFPAAAE